jgi:hypothetical protein
MRFLSHPYDVAALARSIELARSVAATAAMKPFVVREVAPGRALKGEELANFIRNGATTYFHSSGACRMGKDDKAVVDSQLRVNGVHNLRIADNTIMPRIVAAPTMPACVLIGLRLAEMLVGRSRSMREREQSSRQALVNMGAIAGDPGALPKVGACCSGRRDLARPWHGRSGRHPGPAAFIIGGVVSEAGGLIGVADLARL